MPMLGRSNGSLRCSFYVLLAAGKSTRRINARKESNFGDPPIRHTAKLVRCSLTVP